MLVDLYNFKNGIIDVGKEGNKFFEQTKDWDFSIAKKQLNGNTEATEKWINSLQLSDDNLKGFLRTWDGSGEPIQAYQQYLKDSGKATSTFANITSKAKDILKSFGASLASMAINMVIGMAIQALSDYIHKSEIAREKSVELTDAWEAENSSIDESIKKYDELKKKIDSGTLSTEEMTSAKNELASIEDTLVEKYGTEALGIDLVNGKYEEQLKTLKELSKEKANQYVIENRGNHEEDIAYLNDTIKHFSGTITAGTSLTNALGFDLDDILNKYSNIGISTNRRGSAKTYKLQTEGTREETYNQLVELYNELEDKFGKENENVNKVLDQITNLLNTDYKKTEIDATKERIKTYAEADILDDSDTRKLYEDAINAVEQYNDALESGEGIDEAKTHLDSVRTSVDNALGEGVLQDISGAKDVFDDIWNSISEGASESSGVLGDFPISYKSITASADSASESVDTLRNSISSVTQAFKEQSENGQISVDTMLSMVEAGYATALQFDATTGACTINRDAMLDLVRAKIENQKRDLEFLQTNIQTKLKEDGVTAQKSANGFYDLAKAKLSNATAEQLISMEQFNNATAQINALQNAMKNLDKIGKGTYTTSSVSKASEDAEKATKEYIDSYMSYMEESLNSGRMDYKTYTKEVSAMLKGMYDDGKLAAKDYHAYTKQMLEVQKDVMDAVVSAVTYRLDKEIKSYQDQIESVEERYESEIEYLDTVIKYYEDQKKALQDNNDEIDRQLALEQAIYNFERAQSQKTKKLYTAGKGVVYTTDTEAVRNASDEVRKAKLDIEIAKLDDAIEKVEQQQEALKDTMNKEKEALQEIIDRLEDYRDKWEEIAKEYEIRQNEMLAQQILGADWESQILSGRLDVLNSFRDSYLAIQQAIADAAWNSAKAQVDAQQYVKDNTGGNDGGGGGLTTTPVSGYEYKKAVTDEESGTVGNDGLLKQELLADLRRKQREKEINELRKRGVGGAKSAYNAAYASGTTNAKRGIHEVAENGDEVIIDNYGNVMVAKGYQLHYFEGGETVKNASESKELINNNGRIIPLKKLFIRDSIIQKSEDVLLGNMSDGFKNLMEYSTTHPIMSNYVQNFNAHKLDYPHINRDNVKPVVQNINLTLPNVTNNSGYERLQKELKQMQIEAYQYAHKR